VPVDLSSVLFVATANRKDKIPGPLFDRMEVIDIAGYTRDDKLAIARSFLIPRQLSDHGLTPEQLELTDQAIERLVTEYTHEAGVRQLAQKVASICRDVAVRVAGGHTARIDADGDFVEQVLGPPLREAQLIEKTALPGVVPTLTWTPAGGELLLIESTRMPGSGQVHVTGHVGDVLKESVAAAFTYLRSRGARFGLSEDFLEKVDVHVHLPKGAMPKDGAAMGLPIIVSLLSLFRGVPVRPDLALTGEITLRGKVLRVDGLKQKCLAAHHAGIAQVVLPKQNEADLEEIPAEILKHVRVHLVSNVDEALHLSVGPASSGWGAQRAAPPPA
jgi:ATP-dependent Lon protease